MKACFRVAPAAFGALMMSACGHAQPEAAPAAQNIAITVEAGARQKFAGFGTSLGNWGGDYQKLTAAERTQLSRLLWRDLGFKTLRMWLNTNEFAPTPGAHDLTIFRRNYVDSGIIADAKKEGVTTLLLAPDGLPEGMKEKQADGKTVLRESEVENYAVLLADFIQRLRDETGVLLNATGVQNEPNDNERFSAAQIVAIVKRLRRELDARGLKSVQIIASEHASSDGVLYEHVDALKNDAEAWNALSGVASHSYNMAATDDIAKRIAAPNGQNLKDYWMTEASENGAEQPGDAFRAASLASRFLNDMNHRVTHWIHFLGFEVPDAKDNATRIMAFTANPLKTTLFQKYFYYQQLSNAFDAGAVFRDSKSSLDGDMTWTYGKKPRVIAASAQNPDGSWSAGFSNYTADSFAGVQGWADEKWNQEQGGYTPGQTFQVTLNIEELKGRGTIPFVVHRSSAKLQNADSGTALMKDGQLTLTIAPLELVTLRSKKP